MKNNNSFAALCALSAGILLLSCNKDLTTNKTIANGTPDPVGIRLAPVCIGGGTKSFEETTVTTLQHEGFNCMSYLSGSGTLYFDNDVIYDGQNYIFKDVSYYYPLEGALDFYAFYPKGLKAGMNQQKAFQVAFDHDPDADLVVAAAYGRTRLSGEVVFEFDHVLANVGLKCKAGDPDVDYKLLSLELVCGASGIYDVGRGLWAIGSNVVSEQFARSTETLTGTYRLLGDYVSCIPAAASVRAKWKCIDKNTGTVLAEYDQSVPVNLVPGCRSTFNLTLPNSKAMKIDCVVAVSSWDTASQDVVIF